MYSVQLCLCHWTSCNLRGTVWALLKFPLIITYSKCSVSHLTSLKGNPGLLYCWWCSVEAPHLFFLQNWCPLKHARIAECSQRASHLLSPNTFYFKAFHFEKQSHFFSLIMPSNFVQRNESWSWLGWKLSQSSEGLTLSSHVERFWPQLLRTSLRGKDKLVHGNLLTIHKRKNTSLYGSKPCLGSFSHFKFSIYMFLLSFTQFC